ncbi:Casein kinase II, regulatory subunit [Penicillium camemberti]|uniref:Casein kinase II subunit beta n=1 Tax=Penicillium camemberti (strain FM 013) TaxID=1429867 RepID=A0A0G4NZV5_PENC3|nr:Casein kinase II, regulatory subunit [Penicillium camemberti]
MEHNMTRRVLFFFLVFLAACAGSFFTRAGDFARDQDMETCFLCISMAILCLMWFVRLLPLYVQLRLNLVDDRNGSNEPPGPDSDAGAGQRARQSNDHSSQVSRRGAGGGGSSTSSCYSTTTYPPSSGRYRDAILITIVLMTIMYSQFVSSRGNEYFCEIDEDYLTDRFNLTGLNTEVSYYQYALDLVTDVFDLDADDDLREQIEKSARHLYGLVHARYIVTTRGLAKMLEKYKKSDFGKCPRVMCDGHALLPLGESDLPNVSTVKLYCPKCEDIYNPKSSRHSSIDGAYFGTSFHSVLFQVYPALNPEKSSRRYEPRIYGFKVHSAAALARYQDNQREDLKWRLAEADITHRFIEDSESDDDAFEYDEDYAEGPAEPAKNDKLLGDAASARMNVAK